MTEIIAIAAVAIVAWFAAGTAWNIQRGRVLMRWMQDGLPVLGERSTLRWLGSTAVELAIRAAKAPFAGITLIIFLEARDMPWMWALGRARGRRDMLIIRGVMPQVPEIEFEALDPASWSGREALGRVPQDWQVRRAAGAGDLAVYASDANALARADVLLARARRTGLAVKRLSVRRNEPHFQVHVAMPDERQPARAFFEAVHALAGLALE